MNKQLKEVFDQFPGVPTAKVWSIQNREGLFVSNYDPVLDVILPDHVFCVFSSGLKNAISLLYPTKIVNNVAAFEMVTFNLLHPPKHE